MEKESTEPTKSRDDRDDNNDNFQSNRIEKDKNEDRESDDDDDDRSDGGKEERINSEEFHQRIRFTTPDINYTPTRKSSEYKLVFTTEKKVVASEKPRKRLHAKFNSFTYTESENVEFLKRHQHIDPQSIKRLSVVRWLMSFFVGICVALICIAVTLCTKYLTAAKLAAVYAQVMKDCRHPECLVLPTIVWMTINMTLIFVGSYFVTFHAPLAAGSGIPNVKCYLNGIRMPGLMSLRTLVAKAGGVILSVAGGLACGKEGPMIHSGAICASGLARAEIRCGKKAWRPQVCDPLRTDEERRDFVAAGAASGVSAAFGSPVGGVLFSLEEGTSFVKQMLTWRMLFSSMTACLVLNVLLSAIYGHPEDMSHPGLVSFGHIGEVSFRTFEIPFFILMGTFGGLTGALFVHINYKVTLFRRKYVTNPWLKVAEAVFLASCSAILFVTLIYVMPDCQPIRGVNVTCHSPSPSNDTDVISDENSTWELEDDDDVMSSQFSNQSLDEERGHDPYGFHEGHGYVFQGFCPCGEHNRMADILFKTGEGGLHALLHGPLDEWSIVPLFVLFIVYHLLATWTYGLSVSSGVFIPSLLIGAIWGRMVGIAVMTFIPSAGTNVAKYVLVGAAANLGGATRMTLSLTVIIIECTGDITFGVPIMLALIAAKWTGDYFNPGIYDLHIEIQGIPLLPWEPPAMSYAIKASEVMTSPVTCLRSRESIETLQSILRSPCSHNGYPVVSNELPPPSSVTSASASDRFPRNNNNNNNDNRNGGLDRKCRLAAEGEEVSDTRVSSGSSTDTAAEMKGEKTTFGRLFGFLHTKDIEYILANASAESRDEVDIEPFIERSPYSIHLDTSLPRVFKIFRGLGLRHLIVVNDRYQVVGIITRVNLARYRGEMHKGNFVLEELKVVQ